ncbi:MAG: heat-inducible transcription repressor HrcA [Chloroflexi bacterium]|nr:heat-inducible transcription repressor HrcA [Chloroflexota bacterium]
MKLSGRQETLLALIVREYVDSPAPVSSKSIREKYGLSFSPATIRNEMAALTESGFLRQPHTSAGRVPTEEGYRYFVQQVLGEVELPIAEQNTISHQFHQTHGDVNQWMRLAASVLSQHTRSAALITAPRSQGAHFKHIELIATQGRQVLMVLVLSGGEIRQQMLTLAEPVQQEQLSETAHRLNAQLAGQSADGIRSLSAHYAVFENEIARLAADLLGRDDSTAPGEIYRDGVSRMLAEPEFANTETALHARRVLEEQSFLQEFLAKVLSPNVGSVQVVIGGEGDWEELKDCSMVLARYGINNVATGALGILGPTRMAYGRAISTVRYVAGLMTDLVQDAYGES